MATYSTPPGVSAIAERWWCAKFSTIGGPTKSARKKMVQERSWGGEIEYHLLKEPR